MKSKVKNEVRILEQRVKSRAAIQRLSLHVTFDSLAKSEKLRQRTINLCLRLTRRLDTPIAIAEAAGDLLIFADNLTCFHKPLPAWDMRKVRAFMKKPA